MWPFRRRDPASEPTGSSAAPPLPAPRRDWASLPPIQRTVTPLPLTVERASFEQGLAALRPADTMLESLGHVVDPDGPSGVIEDLVTVSRPPTAPPPAGLPELRLRAAPAAPPAAARRRPAGGGLSPARGVLTVARAAEPETRPLPVVADVPVAAPQAAPTPGPDEGLTADDPGGGGDTPSSPAAPRPLVIARSAVDAPGGSGDTPSAPALAPPPLAIARSDVDESPAAVTPVPAVAPPPLVIARSAVDDPGGSGDTSAPALAPRPLAIARSGVDDEPTAEPVVSRSPDTAAPRPTVAPPARSGDVGRAPVAAAPVAVPPAIASQASGSLPLRAAPPPVQRTADPSPAGPGPAPAPEPAVPVPSPPSGPPADRPAPDGVRPTPVSLTSGPTAAWGEAPRTLPVVDRPGMPVAPPVGPDPAVIVADPTSADVPAMDETPRRLGLGAPLVPEHLPGVQRAADAPAAVSAETPPESGVEAAENDVIPTGPPLRWGTPPSGPTTPDEPAWTTDSGPPDPADAAVSSEPWWAGPPAAPGPVTGTGAPGAGPPVGPAGAPVGPVGPVGSSGPSRLAGPRPPVSRSADGSPPMPAPPRPAATEGSAGSPLGDRLPAPPVTVVPAGSLPGLTPTETAGPPVAAAPAAPTAAVGGASVARLPLVGRPADSSASPERLPATVRPVLGDRAPAAALGLAPTPGPSGRGAEVVPAGVRSTVEAATGAVLSGVRVQRDDAGATTAGSLGARAFTDGGHVHLPAHHGSLDDPPARALLAHELVHVAQQRQLGAGRPAEATAAGQRLERQALQVERAVAGGQPLPLATHPVASSDGGAASWPDPAQAAIDAGVAQRSPDGSVVFGPPGMSGGSAGPGPQRATTPASGGGEAAGGGDEPGDKEAKAKEAYDMVRSQLLAELRMDRERAGLVGRVGR